MKEITLQRLGSNDIIPEAVKSTYLGSFPEEERRDWEDIAARVSAGDPIFSLYLIRNNGDPVGFVTTWRLPDALYVEHLAVYPDKRSGGIGSAVLAEIADIAAGKPVVLEVELPETSDEARRRIEFYTRNGFMAMDQYPYFQPPYRPGGPTVPLMLMVTSPLPDPDRFVIMLHTLVYNQ